MENIWLAQAKRLQALASTGLHFCTDDFERERLEEIAEIAHSMLAQLADVPLERITGLVSDFAKRYSTPMIEVRGAVIDGDRILLVRESTDGCWALPGGYADIGLSAAENIVKEIREEAGLSVTARTLYSVMHKAKGLYRPDVRDFYKLYFLCERVDQLAPMAGLETTEVGFLPCTTCRRCPVGAPSKAILKQPLRFIAASSPKRCSTDPMCITAALLSCPTGHNGQALRRYVPV